MSFSLLLLSQVILAQSDGSDTADTAPTVSGRFDKWRKTPKAEKKDTYIIRNTRVMKKNKNDFVGCFESNTDSPKGEGKSVTIKLYVTKGLKIKDVSVLATGFVANSAFKKCVIAIAKGWDLENPTGKDLLVNFVAKYVKQDLKSSVKRRRS